MRLIYILSALAFTTTLLAVPTSEAASLIERDANAFAYPQDDGAAGNDVGLEVDAGIEAAGPKSIVEPAIGEATLSKGQRIYNAAAKYLGTPYVYGGGSCTGPTMGGFDCSGLVRYAIHTVIPSKCLPHKAQQQYTHGTQQIPRSQAKIGDAIFWGTNGDCKNGVRHVGIVKDGKRFINAPHKGAVVRVQDIWTRSGSLRICDFAVRFY